MIKNPYENWKKQCRTWLAVSITGIPVDPRSKEAIAWCARGWIYKVMDKHKDKHNYLKAFNIYLIDQHQRPITYLNDYTRFTPVDFFSNFQDFLEKGGLKYEGKNAARRREFDNLRNQDLVS